MLDAIRHGYPQGSGAMSKAKMVGICCCLVVAAACSETPAPEADLPSTVTTIDSRFGGFVTLGGDLEVTVVFPPAAFAADTEVTLSVSDTGRLPGSQSPTFEVAAPAPLLLPAAVSVYGAEPGMTWGLAQLEGESLTLLPQAFVDTMSGELSATMPQLGSVVVVDQADPALPELARPPEPPSQIASLPQQAAPELPSQSQAGPRSGPSQGSVGTATPSSAAGYGGAPTPTTTPSGQPPASGPNPEQQGGFFRRMGSRIKGVGGRVVTGVKNIGKNSAQQAEASMEQQVDAIDHMAQQKIHESETALANEIEQAGDSVTQGFADGAEQALGTAGLDGGGGWSSGPSYASPRDPCSLVSPAELQATLGAYQQRQYTDRMCQFIGAAGSVSVDVDWSGGRTRAKSYQAMRRNGTCGPPNDIGDESCTYQMSSGIRIFLRRGRVDATVEARTGPDSRAVAARFGRDLAAHL